MTIPFLDLKAQYEQIKEEVEASVLEVLRSGAYILGPKVGELEAEIAEYCGTRHAVAVASGTDALVLVLDALGIGPGDEVITTPFTFFATAESISRVGATPVFVDIEPGSFNIDPQAISGAITERTKAIIPVHLFGRPADMDPINAIAAGRDLVVIEDACQAIGAEYKGRRAGGIGRAAAFSFYPTKNLGGLGDGGMVTLDDADLTARIKLLRDHGSPKRYYHSALGYNSRLDAIQAVVLSIKLKYLDSWNEARLAIARRYSAGLEPLGIGVPKIEEGSSHVFHLYTARSNRRDEIVAVLHKSGVACGIYYPLPLHLQEVYKGLGYRKGSLPETERAAAEVFSLPIYPELGEDRVDEVVEIVENVLSKVAG